MTAGLDPELLAAELERLRRVATQVRSELTDDRDFTQRKLNERDDQLRAQIKEARELEALLDRMTRDRDAARQAEAENYARVKELRSQVQAIQRNYDRLKGRRVVRYALRLAELLRPLITLVRRFRNAAKPPPPSPPVEVEPPARFDDEERAEAGHGALASLLTDHLPAAPRAGGPKVSVVVLNRDGIDHLRRLLPGLERTDYEPFDVVVVDNASTDGSLAELERWQRHLPLEVIRNDENVSFSAGNDQGIAASDGDLVLLLNNDIEPVEPGWLGRMVDALLTSGAGAVGARLLYPHRPGLDNVGDAAFADLSVQHRGIRFQHGNEGADPDRGVDGMPLPRHAGKGGEALAGTGVEEVPVATAACLLVRRDVLEAVGGMTEGYVYGTEDVDLCLKIAATGWRTVVCHDAVLWHHEFGTQNVEGAQFKGENRRRNRELFIDRWGPRLHREVLLDRLRGIGHWSEEPLRIAFAGGALLPVEVLGWEVEPYPDDVKLDVVVVRSPAFDLRSVPRHVASVGWVDGDVDAWLDARWFDDLDVVVVADEGTAQRVLSRSTKVPVVASDRLPVGVVLRDALIRWAEAPRAAILISTPDWDVAEVWGDTHYGRAFQKELERRGMPVRLVLRGDFDAPWVAQSDVVVHLLGLTEYRTRPAQLNVLWNISHPELTSAELCSRYDLCFIASQRFARELDAEVDVPVLPLPQATDAERFSPDPTGPHHEILFVANSRRTRRPIVDDLTPTRHGLAIYGGDWFPELVDPRYVRGEVVPNVELPSYYTSADIVLNDHWPEMREHGFISNRLYDALAAGAFVISDPLEGLDDEFDGGVVTYTDRADLAEKVDRYLADPDARREHVEMGRRAVLRRHTFAHRADTVLAVLAPHLADRPLRITPTADAPQADAPAQTPTVA